MTNYANNTELRDSEMITISFGAVNTHARKAVELQP